MEGKKYFCTDVYICIRFQADCHDFVLTERKRNVSILMQEIERNDVEIIYHANVCFEIARAPAFEIDFALGTVFRPVLKLGVVSDSFLSRRNGAMVAQEKSVMIFKKPPTNDAAKRWLPTMTSVLNYTGPRGMRGVDASIELHCYERHDDV